MQINLLQNTELHNVILGQNGLETRKGLRAVLDKEDVNSLIHDGLHEKFVFGFSAESANTGEVFHYLFSIYNKYLYQSLWDDQFNCLGIARIGKLTADLEPFSYAINYNQIVVNSRSLPYPLWGFIGGTLVKAEKQQSINPDTPSLTLFPGRVCGFADRFVWAYANQIIINDPGTEPRTICAPNAISFGGTVLDLFQAGEGGNLIIVCTDGVYQIPPDGLAGYQFQGFVSRSPGYQGVSSNNAASSRGSVVGLSMDGLIDIGSFQKRSLTTYRRTRKYAQRVGIYESGDYRTGSILPIEEGFIVSIDFKSAIVNLDTGKVTWLYSDSFSDLTTVGILKHSDGREMIVTPNKVFDLFGNTECTNTTVEPSYPDISFCYILVNVPTDPQLSPVIREITVGADRPGTTVSTYVRGQYKTDTIPAPVGVYNVVGVNNWDNTKTYTEREYRSRRLQMAVRIDSPDFELSFNRSTKIDNSADIISKGIGKTRPSN